MVPEDRRSYRVWFEQKIATTHAIFANPTRNGIVSHSYPRLGHSAAILELVARPTELDRVNAVAPISMPLHDCSATIKDR